MCNLALVAGSIPRVIAPHSTPPGGGWGKRVTGVHSLISLIHIPANVRHKINADSMLGQRCYKSALVQHLVFVEKANKANQQMTPLLFEVVSLPIIVINLFRTPLIGLSREIIYVCIFNATLGDDNNTLINNMARISYQRRNGSQFIWLCN